MIMPPSTVQLPIVVALAAELPQLAHGESTPRVQSAARAMGISVQTCWRWLRDAGFASGRKRRADAGTLKALTADQVRQMAAIKLAGARETGKVLPTLEMVRRIANANAAADAETGEVRHTTAHISTIARAMRTLGCHTDQLMRQSPAHSLRSLHPNHVWQVDVSTCVLFYLSNGGIEICDQAAFNKNKPSYSSASKSCACSATWWSTTAPAPTTCTTSTGTRRHATCWTSSFRLFTSAPDGRCTACRKSSWPTPAARRPRAFSAPLSAHWTCR
jgi:transposase-like protein